MFFPEELKGWREHPKILYNSSQLFSDSSWPVEMPPGLNHQGMMVKTLRPVWRKCGVTVERTMERWVEAHTKESPECQAEEFASRSAKVSHARFELQEDVIKEENHLK